MGKVYNVISQKEARKGGVEKVHANHAPGGPGSNPVSLAKTSLFSCSAGVFACDLCKLV